MKKLSEVFSEQHREKGRFKPTIPRMVSNKSSASPRPTSDSANVSLRERCWTGYRQIGMKKKGDRMVPNCVQDSVEIPTDAPSIQTIAKKHGVSEEEIQKQLEMGIKVEQEHTSDIQAATEIALDHLNEKPDYYTRLKTIGEANAAAIAAATAISKKKSGNYDKEGMRKTPYKNPDHPNVKSNEQRRKEVNEEMGGKQEMQVQGTAAMTLTSKPNKEPMKTYKELKNITELSTDLLHRYKEKAAADASKADKEGDIARGNKRFSGVVRATNKQFANFKKKGFSEDVTKKPETFKTIKPKENEHETYFKFVSGKAKMGKALSNKEKDFVKSYKLMKQEEVEQIDEISAQAHKEYQAAARKDVAALAKHTGGEYGDIAKNIMKRRMKGLSTSTALQARDTMKKIKEAKDDKREYDYEGEMVKSDLRSIIANANRLIDMLGDDDNLPEWCQNKITLAEDYISTVANYMTAEMNEEVEQLDEKNAPTNPGLWSRAKALARSKFDVYPSAYANGWASKWYKSKGGGWKSVSEEVEQIDELSKTTLASYATKAADDAKNKKDAATSYAAQMKGYSSKGMQKSVKADKRIEGVKGAIKRLAKEAKEDLPFTPDKPKKQSVVAGKYGAGYSTARHLARTAMQKQVEKMKKAPIKEESRKAAIVKDIMKKKKGSEDAFQKDPELSNTLTKV